MTFPNAPNGINKRPAQGFSPERRPEKARIHTGGVARLQYWSLRAMRSIERILQPGDRLLYSVRFIGLFPTVILLAPAATALQLHHRGGTRETLEKVHRLMAR
jgi:hypothetical protein